MKTSSKVSLLHSCRIPPSIRNEKKNTFGRVLKPDYTRVPTPRPLEWNRPTTRVFHFQICSKSFTTLSGKREKIRLLLWFHEFFWPKKSRFICNFQTFSIQYNLYFQYFQKVFVLSIFNTFAKKYICIDQYFFASFNTFCFNTF